MSTMTDVARLAGVSVSTVSYVLTGARPISQPTRERVERAMRKLGYTPNAIARSLKSKRSNILALSFPTFDQQLGLTSLEYVLGASDRAQSRGYHLLLCTTELGQRGDLVQLAREGLVNGVLLMEVERDDGRIPVLRDAGLEFAMIGRTDDPAGLDYTDTDFAQCAQLSLGYLAESGHRRIGFVNRPDSALETGRSVAVRLRDHLAEGARERAIDVTMRACDNTPDAGRRVLAELVAANPGITAVLTLNDRAAIGLMTGAENLGWRVPRDLSIVSLLMTDQVAMLSTPSITTVSPVAEAMSARAVDMLIEKLEGEDMGPRQELFECTLAVRGSSAPAPRRRRKPFAPVSA